MKILQVNCVYNVGSTGKIVFDIHQGLNRLGCDSFVVYGRGKLSKEPHVYKISTELYSKVNKLCSNISGLMYGGCFFSTFLLKRIITKKKPDVVHLHCINGNFVNIYELIRWLKNKKISTVLTLHAEFMYTANCSHAFDCNQWIKGCKKCLDYKTKTNSYFLDNTAKSWHLMNSAFDNFKEIEIVSVSPWLQFRAEKSDILSRIKHSTILNGIDTDIFYPRSKSSKSILPKEIKDGVPVILHVTANFDPLTDNIKGGKYILELAKLFLSKHIDVQFVVVAGVYKTCQLPSNICLLGSIFDQNRLAELYSIADITVITSKKETFSMICAESLCCGTPVVGFKAGAPELISLSDYSSFVDYGNLDRLLHVILNFLNEKVSKDEISSKAQKVYSRERMLNEYIALYKKMIKNYGESE